MTGKAWLGKAWPVRGLALMTLCAMGACLKSERVAGGTSETTNGDYAAYVSHADGKPAERALVWIVDDGDWLAKVAEGRSVLLDSTRTDSLGAFKVNLPGGHRYNLQIDAGVEALFLRDVKGESPSAAPIALQAMHEASFSGHVQADSGLIREVRLAGTAYSALVGRDSAYRFTGVAAGSYDIIAVLNRNGALMAVPIRAMDLAAGEDVKGIDLSVATDRIMANNFEQDFWYQTQIGLTFGGGWSASQSGTATIQSGITADPAQAFSGKSLENTIVFRTGGTGSARVGFAVDGAINLANMASISLYAMGTGRVYLRFHSRALNALTADTVQFQAPIDLSPGWTHVIIPVSSLALTPNAPPQAQGFAWLTAAKDILSVDFVAATNLAIGADSLTQAFDLDDFSFEGVALQDLKK